MVAGADRGDVRRDRLGHLRDTDSPSSASRSSGVLMRAFWPA